MSENTDNTETAKKTRTRGTWELQISEYPQEYIAAALSAVSESGYKSDAMSKNAAYRARTRLGKMLASIRRRVSVGEPVNPDLSDAAANATFSVSIGQGEADSFLVGKRRVEKVRKARVIQPISASPEALEKAKAVMSA